MNAEFDYQKVVFGAGWELQREDRNLGGLRLDRALHALQTEPGIRQGRVLEAGCGVGRFTAPLAAQMPQARVVAFDLSATAVTRAAGRGDPVAYAVADALALPFPASVFDAVLFFDLLEHLMQPGVVLAEFAGYVPCESEPLTLHWLLRPWVHQWTGRHAGHVSHFRHAEVIALAEQAGLEIVNVQYSYHLLGQVLDVVTFAAREVIFRRGSAGQAQPEAYYDRSVLGSSRTAWLYGSVRRLVEVMTFAEARLLGDCRWALGVHLTARRME